MAVKFTKGTPVRQIVKPIEGTIVDFQLNKDSGEIAYLVEYENEAGEPSSRYFDEDQIESV